MGVKKRGRGVEGIWQRLLFTLISHLVHSERLAHRNVPKVLRDLALAEEPLSQNPLRPYISRGQQFPDQVFFSYL